MNKFEYLPIKCKVSMAQENWVKYSANTSNLDEKGNYLQLKTKVQGMPDIMQLYFLSQLIRTVCGLWCTIPLQNRPIFMCIVFDRSVHCCRRSSYGLWLLGKYPRSSLRNCFIIIVLLSNSCVSSILSLYHQLLLQQYMANSNSPAESIRRLLGGFSHQNYDTTVRGCQHCHCFIYHRAHANSKLLTTYLLAKRRELVNEQRVGIDERRDWNFNPIKENIGWF